MNNIKYQENIAEAGEIKIRQKNIKSYALALALCNKFMRTSGLDEKNSVKITQIYLTSKYIKMA